MSLSPFSLCIIAIVLLGALGLPIGHSMIVASIFYLLLSGLDLGTAAEQILNGLFNSYVLLAIPLFILAADLMNIGSLTDRLLQFCLVLVGRFRPDDSQEELDIRVRFPGSARNVAAFDQLKITTPSGPHATTISKGTSIDSGALRSERGRGTEITLRLRPAPCLKRQ